MAKFTNYIAAGLLICFAFALSDCKKTRHKEFVEMDTDSAVIARLNFKPGTWWIYRDFYTGRTDSFYVRSNYYTAQEEQYNIYNYHFLIIAQLNYDGTAPADSANWVFDFEGTQIMMEYDYTNYAYGWKNQIQFRPLYRYPYKFGDQFSRYDTAALTQVDSFFTVNGLDFYNVAHEYHESNADSATSGLTITKLQDMFYISDSVGMVQMTLNHPYHGIHRDWRLVRFNIVR